MTDSDSPAESATPLSALPTELAEPILAVTVQLVAASSLWNPTAIHAPLTVLSRTHAPLVTKAALLQLPRVDLTFATMHGDVLLLDFMLDWSKQPNGRPLNYVPMDIVPLALERGITDLLDWWLDHHDELVIDWDWSNRALVHAFCGQHGILWMEWWRARGFPYLDDQVTFPSFVAQVSANGCVAVLDWLLDDKVRDRVVPRPSDPDVLLGAASSGHVHVLDWWMAKAQSAVCKRPEFNGILAAAFRENQMAVLEWCKRNPQIADAWRYRRLGKSRAASFADCVFADAVRHGLLDWFEALGLQPYDNELGDASIAACQMGNLLAVKSLFTQGRLVGSRLQLIQEAMVSGNLALLDWIQAHISDTAPASSNGSFVQYRGPYVTACGGEHAVCVLDWLTANGYPLPPHASEVDASASLFGRPAARETMLGTAVHQYHEHKVDVLDWLLAHCFADEKVAPADLAKCLVAASGLGFVDVLDWISGNWSKLSDLSSLADLDPTTIVDATERATRGNHGTALNWWSEHVALTNVDVLSLGNPRPYSHLHAAFSSGRNDVIEWWMHKSGQLKACFDLGCGEPYLIASALSEPSTFVGQVAALQVWVQDGQPIDFARLIHNTSICGRIDVLDWLLNQGQVRASASEFICAWSDPQIVSKSTHSSGSSLTHGPSLVWWRANMSTVVAETPGNCGLLDNPIHAHLLECATKDPERVLLELVDACKDVPVESTAMFMYLNSRGCLDLLHRIRRRCLTEASQLGMVHALEWWKSCSHVPITCPHEIAEGRSIVRKRAQQWWARSGLVTIGQVERMAVPY